MRKNIYILFTLCNFSFLSVHVVNAGFQAGFMNSSYVGIRVGNIHWHADIYTNGVNSNSPYDYYIYDYNQPGHVMPPTLGLGFSSGQVNNTGDFAYVTMTCDSPNLNSGSGTANPGDALYFDLATGAVNVVPASSESGTNYTAQNGTTNSVGLKNYTTKDVNVGITNSSSVAKTYQYTYTDENGNIHTGTVTVPANSVGGFSFTGNAQNYTYTIGAGVTAGSSNAGTDTSFSSNTNNGIVWTATNGASGSSVVFDPTVNSTLQAGFSAVSGYLIDTKSLLNSTMMATSVETNLEGQVITSLFALTNDIMQLVATVTNFGMSNTNLLARLLTNASSGSSTISLSNIVISATNLADAQTAVGASNLLSRIYEQFVSNSVVSVSNSSTSWTNGLTDDQLRSDVTNSFSLLSNSIAGILTSQTIAGSNSSFVSDSVGKQLFASGLNSLPSDPILPDSFISPAFPGVNIHLSDNLSFVAFSTDDIDSLISEHDLGRSLFGWVIIITLFGLTWNTFYLSATYCFLVPQARTAGTEILGSSANVGSAFACGSAIVALISVLPTLFISHLLFSLPTVVSGVSSGMYSFNTFAAIDFVDHYFPIITLSTAVVSYVVVKIFAQSVGLGISAVVKMLVGL